MIRIIGPALFLLYAILIGYVSLAPNPDGTSMPYDKLAHLVAYVAFALAAVGLNLSRRGYLYVCLLIIVYGGLLEVAQSLVPGRYMSLPDLLANTAGVALGAVAGLMWFRRGYEAAQRFFVRT